MKNLNILVLKFFKSFTLCSDIAVFWNNPSRLLGSSTHINKIKNKTWVFIFLWNANRWWLWGACRTNSKNRRTAKNISFKLVIFIKYNFIFIFTIWYQHRLATWINYGTLCQKLNVWISDFMIITNKMLSWFTLKPKKNILT